MYYILDSNNIVFAIEASKPKNTAYPGYTIIYSDNNYSLEQQLTQEQVNEGTITITELDTARQRAIDVYQQLVGKNIMDMTLSDLRLLLAFTAYREGLLDINGVVKPLSQIKL